MMKVYNGNARNEFFEVVRYCAVGSVKLTARVNTLHSFDDCCFLSIKTLSFKTVSEDKFFFPVWVSSIRHI